MVFYFKSEVVSPGYELYMGKDKYENEELIRWGWPEDVWFHVDNYSSAHVYLRLKMGQTLDDVPLAVIEDAAQLVKANSIQGNKINDIDVVYTMWSNLKKTPDMEAGRVTYENKNVKKIHLNKRINEIVNRLNKTKIEHNFDLRNKREERDDKEKRKRTELQRLLKQAETDDKKKKELESKTRCYSTLMNPEKMKTNHDDGNESDDFW